MAVTTAALSGTITDLGLDIPTNYLGRVTLVVEANTPGSLLIDTSGNRHLTGAKRVTVDRSTGAYTVTLVTTNSADVVPTTGRLYRATLTYPSGVPGAGNVTQTSGWFELTADASLADVWTGLATTAVAESVYENMTDALMAGIDSNSASDFRVQQDARHAAAYVSFDLSASGDATGVADRTAIAALLTAAATGLREKQITLAPGIYYSDAALVPPAGVRLRCLGGGETAGAEYGAVIRYVGGPIPRFIDARNLLSGTLEGLVIQGGGTFAGTLLDLEGAQFVNITDCTLSGQGAGAPARGVDLKNANQISFTRVNFVSMVDGVRGISATSGQYAEIIRFYDCNFGTNGGGELSGKAIRNPNTDWVFVGCNFQPSATGAPCGVGTDSLDYPFNGLTFMGCWWGDITTAYAGTDPWLDCKSNWGNGVTVLGGNATMGTSAPFATFGGAGNQSGLVIKGLTANAVPTGTSATFVALAGGGSSNVEITGINYAGTWASNPVTGTPGPGSSIQQPLGGITTTNAGGLLGCASYNPATPVAGTFSSTDADVDATNLAVTFIAPPSGTVLVRSAITVYGAADADVFLTLRSGASTVTGSRARALLVSTGDETAYAHIAVPVKIAGLTPGNSYTYKLGGFKQGTGTAGPTYGDDGGGYPPGPAVMEVWAA